MGNKMLPDKIIKRLKETQDRLEGRDRWIVMCVGNYTDLALGLGETQVGLSLMACSSSWLAKANERADLMGHEAGALKVNGKGDEGFKRFLGTVAKAWCNGKWGYRFLELEVIRAEGVEVGYFFAKGDLNGRKINAEKSLKELKRVFEIYGVNTTQPTPSIWIKEDCSRLEKPWDHPSQWLWLHKAVELAHPVNEE